MHVYRDRHWGATIPSEIDALTFLKTKASGFDCTRTVDILSTELNKYEQLIILAFGRKKRYITNLGYTTESSRYMLNAPDRE